MYQNGCLTKNAYLEATKKFGILSYNIFWFILDFCNARSKRMTSPKSHLLWNVRLGINLRKNIFQSRTIINSKKISKNITNFSYSFNYPNLRNVVQYLGGFPSIRDKNMSHQGNGLVQINFFCIGWFRVTSTNRLGCNKIQSQITSILIITLKN